MSDADTFEYAMPSLGADMDEGRVIEWRVAPGDTVHRGDLIAVVETEKSDIDIEIWHDGVVDAFLVDIGETVDVGTPIVRLRVVGDAPPPTPTAAPPTSVTTGGGEPPTTGTAPWTAVGAPENSPLFFFLRSFFIAFTWMIYRMSDFSLPPPHRHP